MGDCQNCQELQDIVNDTRSVSNLRQKNVDDLKNKVDQLNDNLECQVQQFELMRDEARSQREKFTKEKSQYEDTIANQKSQIDTLNFQVVDMKGRENLLIQEKKVLDDKVTLISTQRDGYLAQVKQLTAQVRSLEEGQELAKKEQEIQRLENEIKNYQQKLRSEEETGKRLQQELSGYQKTLADHLEMPEKTLKEYISMLIEQNQTLQREKMDQISINGNLFSEIDGLNAEIKRLNEEKDEMREHLDQLKEKYGSVSTDKVLYQYKEVKTADQNPEKKFYDCRILADTFFPLLQNKSWEIEFKDWEDYKKRILEKSVRVSVLGYENTGKSFMISKVMGHEVPQGKQTKTQGICILYPDDTKIPWTALDTPGTNISIRTEFMKKELEEYFNNKQQSAKKDQLSNEQKLRLLYGDNILIESMLQEFVVNHSQVLLIVVGKMRRDDQRFINRLKNQKEFANKRFIIVHNLMDCTTREDVDAVIKEDIIDTFDAQQRAINVAGSQNQFVYLEKDKKNTEHVVLAHQDSPAGQHYNESAIAYIKNVISTSPFNETFDLVEAFRSHLNLSFASYLSTTINPAPKHPFILHSGDGETAKPGAPPQGFKLENSESYDLKLNFTDEFGKIRTYTEDALETVPFVVKVATITTTKGEEKYLQVEFEVSGRCNDNEIKARAQVTGNLVVIKIKGTSEDNNQRENGELIRQNTRRFGEFLITTNPIDIEGYTIFRGERHTISSDVPGLKTISFRMYPEKDDEF